MKKKNIQRVSALIILALIIFLFRPAYTPSINRGCFKTPYIYM